MKNQLILFDCDGTLTDSHGAIIRAMGRAFEASGLAAPKDADVSAVIGLSLHDAVARLSPNAQFNRQIEEGYRTAYRADEASLQLYPGVRETLDELKQRGYWMGIVTGKSRPGLLRVLEQFDLGHYFYVLRTADCCPSKPHPAMVEECMEEMGVHDPALVTLIGDARFDMQMAVAVGVRALGVSFGVEDRDSLLEAGAEQVLDEFPALIDYFPPLQGGTLPDIEKAA